MTTKIDKEWASDTVDRVQALVREVERLEGILERIEKLIVPYASPGGDTEWLVKNCFGNMAQEIVRLKSK
jgi:hypothetical protein